MLKGLSDDPPPQSEVPIVSVSGHSWPYLSSGTQASRPQSATPSYWLYTSLICTCKGSIIYISRQYLRCALVRGRGIVFRHFYRSLAKSAGKDFREGAVVPFE
jgi:hypothetical protein